MYDAEILVAPEEGDQKTEWRKIGVNLTYRQARQQCGEYAGYVTRTIKSDRREPGGCQECNAPRGHWLSCKSVKVKAVTVPEGERKGLAPIGVDQGGKGKSNWKPDEEKS
jgi:hypothetical protein